MRIDYLFVLSPLLTTFRCIFFSTWWISDTHHSLWYHVVGSGFFVVNCTLFRYLHLGSPVHTYLVNFCAFHSQCLSFTIMSHFTHPSQAFCQLCFWPFFTYILIGRTLVIKSADWCPWSHGVETVPDFFPGDRSSNKIYERFNVAEIMWVWHTLSTVAEF